ncbi:RTA1 like protein-domain-containing protein [Fusarium avenaceum]|nr:RTA1 like protein-domain-containing protein [Fusarium avenaceum]
MSTEGLFAPVPGVEPTKGGVYLWRYLPSAVAAILFLILFLGSFLFISWKIWRTRTWFCIAFATGCFFQMLGYGIRAGARNKTNKIMPYAVQNMFILVAPALFAASIYMILGRIIRGLNADRHSLLKPAKLTRTFVLGDVLSFMIQGGGGGMSAIQNPTLVKWAERLVIFGLVVQIVIFGLFCVVSVVFHRRMLRTPTAESIGTIIPWESTLYMLYGVSLLIMVRSIFRVIEYAQGYTGYALSHEWTLYVFDTLLMWLVTIIFAWRYPSDINTSHSHFNDVLLQEVQSDK